VALGESRECIETQGKMLARASEGGIGRPQFFVNVVYGQPLSHEETESGPVKGV
jgi:hypothetical protein